MDNPIALVKRAPKWAIYASGGVVIGAVALKAYKSKTAAATPADTTADTTQVGADATYAAPSGSPGPVVSPVIVDTGAADQSGTGLGDLQTLYMGGVQSVFDAASGLVGGLFQQNSQLVDIQANTTGSLLDSLTSQTGQIISAVAGAGSAPQPVAQNPTVVNTPAPIAVAPTPAAPAPAAPKKCGTAPYTNLNEANGKCYAVVCASGTGAKRKGRWHVYQDGSPDVFISSTC